MKKKYWIPACAGMTLIAACATLAPGKAPVSPYAAATDKLSAFIQHEMADKNLPALSVALVDDQQTVWAQGFGLADPEAKKPATAETVYRIGSVSKLFTDIAVMQQVEQGHMSLDAPVTQYLPDFKPKNPFDKPITLRQLMTHRSGLVREPPVGHYFDPTGPTLAATVASLNDTTLVYAPESTTKYSNAAIATVGYALEVTRREPFAKYLKHAVLDPLGMTHSGFEPTQELTANLAKGYMLTVEGRTFEAPTFELGLAPAGCMYSTVTDLARFASTLLAGGGAILKPDSLKEMLRVQYASPGADSGFGLGFMTAPIDGRRVIGHSGAIYGFASTLWLLPQEKVAVAVITTQDAANGVTKRIAQYAMQLMTAAHEGRPLPEAQVTTAIPPDQALALDGRYVNGKHHLELIERAGQLFLFAEGAGELRLRALGPELIVDDRLDFGAIRLTPRDGGLALGGDFFRKVAVPRPKPAPKKWRGLIGEYGWDHDTLFILEKDGALWALIEWLEFDKLKQLGKDEFAFPEGLYSGEHLRFVRDAKGRATHALAGPVDFARRAVGPEDGGGQLHVEALRPVPELLKEAQAAQPPVEQDDFLPTDLVELAKLDPGIHLDIRYAGTNNFLGTKFYTQPRAFMQRAAAEALVRAHRKLKALGYGLLIHDAYRPWSVTKVFWDATPDDKKMFVADPSKGSRHNRGCAVDLSMYDLKTGQPVEMVGTYDETTNRSNADYPGGTDLQRWHRGLLRDAMESEGFAVFPLEWWHFDFAGWQKYPIGNQRFEEIGAAQ